MSSETRERLLSEDRGASALADRPASRGTGLLVVILAISAAAHGVVIALTLFAARSPSVPSIQETPIEVVEAKPEPKAEPKPESAAKPQPPAEKAAEERKPERVQPDRPAPQPPDNLKPEPAKAASAKAPPPSAEEAKTLNDLKDELAALKAQQAALQGQAEAKPPAQNGGLGLLPDSFAAAAMPTVAPNGEDPVTYQQAVYSLIARAKKTGRRFTPGVAHVTFEVDAQGNLSKVVLDHPSGNPAVDEEAVAIVRRAAPFPAPPDKAPHRFPAYMSFVADE